MNKFVKNSQNHKLLLEKFERLTLSSSQSRLFNHLKRKKNIIFVLAVNLGILLLIIGAMYTYRLALLVDLQDINKPETNVNQVLGETDSNAIKQLQIIQKNVPNLLTSSYVVNYNFCHSEGVSNCSNRSELALAFGSNHYLISRNPSLIVDLKGHLLTDKNQLRVSDQFNNNLYIEDYFLAGEHIFIRVTQNLISPVITSSQIVKNLNLSTDASYGLQIGLSGEDYLINIDNLPTQELLAKLEPQISLNQVSQLWQSGLLAIASQDYNALNLVSKKLKSCACLDNNFQLINGFSNNVDQHLGQQKLINVDRGLIVLTLSASLILCTLFLTIYSYQKIASEFYFNNYQLREYSKN